MKKATTTVKALIILTMIGLFISTSHAQNQKQLCGVIFGGQHDAGAIFKTDDSGNNEIVKYNFVRPGGNPYGSLMQEFDGNLYGMTHNGRSNDPGVLFQFNPVTSTFAKKIDFNGTNGSNPQFNHLIEIPVTITTSSVSLTNCLGSSISVPFTIAGAYDAGMEIVSVILDTITVVNELTRLICGIRICFTDIQGVKLLKSEIPHDLLTLPK